MPTEPDGLRAKYIIGKADGSPVDPKAQYFVLRLDTDPAARIAALVYANCIAVTNPSFADDLRLWVAASTDDPLPSGELPDGA